MTPHEVEETPTAPIQPVCEENKSESADTAEGNLH